MKRIGNFLKKVNRQWFYGIADGIVKRHRNPVIMSLFFLLFLSSLFSAELNFSASVDRTIVGLGETFTLNVSVSGENTGNIPSPKLPDLLDFNIYGRSTSQSTNISIINGKMVQQGTVNFIYTLSPKIIGKLTIGPCKMDYGGKTYETQTIEIEVVKGVTQAPPAQTQPPVAPPSAGDGNLLVLAVPSRTEAFWGEQINVSFYLYTRYSITNVEFVKLPSFSGFWVETLNEPRQLNYQTKVYNGKQYYVALIKSVALFPVTSGVLKVEPMELNVDIERPPRDFFDFFGINQRLKIESKPITINVSVLPVENKPEDFSGGVGKFGITAALDRDSAVGGAPINLIIRVSGTGNIRLIEKPKIPTIPNLKILEPETKEDIQTTGNTIKGTKEFRFPVIAQADGEYYIPEIKIAYFDPLKKKYETIQTTGLKFTASGTSAIAVVTEQGGIKVLGTDIRHIKSDARSLSVQKNDTPKWALILYVISFLIIGISLIYQRHQSRLLVDHAYARRIRSGRFFQKRMKQVEEFLKKDDKKNFYSSLNKAILGYIGDRYNLSIGVLTKEQLKDELSNRGASKELLDQLFQVIEDCDHASYAPQLVGCAEPGEVLKKVKELITNL